MSGRPIALDADYFRRVAAMEFVVKHDDGLAGEGLAEAEIVLVGVSRTGKTPLSMYLGYLGYKTANVPLVRGIEPPAHLFAIEAARVVGLTIDAERLARIRAGACVRSGLARETGMPSSSASWRSSTRRRPSTDGSAAPCSTSRASPSRRPPSASSSWSTRGARNDSGVCSRAMSYVYAFSEGSADMRGLLGGKGAGLAEMLSLGHTRPDGLHGHDRGVRRDLAGGRSLARGTGRRDRRGARGLEERVGLRARGCEHAPAGLGALRRRRVDAGDDGHDPQPRTERRDCRGPGEGERKPAIRARRLPAAPADVRERRRGCRVAPVRGCPHTREARAAASLPTSTSTRDALDRRRPRVPEGLPRGRRAPVPAGSPRAAPACDQLRSSAAGTRLGHACTGGRATSRGTRSGPPSTSARWCSATWATARAPGVCFSRDPSTGERVLYGEFLPQRAGRGRRRGHPHARADLAGWHERAARGPTDSWSDTVRAARAPLGDMQDVEFTVERGALYLLQTRAGKRTAAAAIRGSRGELESEGVIDRDEAVSSRRPEPARCGCCTRASTRSSSYERVRPGPERVARARPSGPAVFDADTAERRGRAGERVILVRWETAPDDIHGCSGAGSGHRARGHDLARGGRRARHGQALRGRRRGCPHRRAEPHLDGGRCRRSRG